MLTACAGSTDFANKPLAIKPVLAPPDVSLTQDCKPPVKLPEDGTLSQLQVETYWGKDRAALAGCGREKAALRDYYRMRDAGLQE